MEGLLAQMSAGEEIVWHNHKKKPIADCKGDLTLRDVLEAAARLERFAPFIQKAFPETAEAGGIIESRLLPIPQMQKALNGEGTLLLKMDSHLPIAGSVKARGGIYEVLKHTENLALENGLLTTMDDYSLLADKKDFFSRYTVQVGSTGNLGMSIGIMSAAIGYKAIVHMSADAKQWKKDLLRAHGVTVMEYESDYSEAVRCGKENSDKDPMSYFVDDENSKDLFLGYAVAALRLKPQLEALGISVSTECPLNVYIPCGVGGAPGGITFGLRQVFGDAVHCYFVEPTQAPCMVLGMSTGKHNGICVRDIGLSGLTHADGLAVGRPSGFVGKVMEDHLDGICTVQDSKLYDYLRTLLNTESVFLEPSACASFHGYLQNKNAPGTHIVWATGGSLVPKEIREQYIETHLD